MCAHDNMPSTRSEAISLGTVTYFTGKPCPKGHVDVRYTGCGGCKPCALARTKMRTESGYFNSRYQANKKKILSRLKRKYRSSPLMRQKNRLRAAKWAADNPERVSAIKNNYKSRRRSQEAGGISPTDIMAWAEKQANVCYWCDSKCDDDLTIDHYKPLSKGGKHELENLVIACRDCNLRKNAKDPYEFAKSVGRLF